MSLSITKRNNQDSQVDFGASVQAVYANLLFAFFQPEKLNSAWLPIQKGAQ
jgi:hypothetical protein